LFTDDYTELAAPVTPAEAQAEKAAAAKLAKEAPAEKAKAAKAATAAKALAAKDKKDGKVAKVPACPALSSLSAADAAKALKKKCSCEWKRKHGWTFGCMWVHPAMEITGCFLMVLLITLSNAGGMSGAGSNIPIMLIFWGMTMPQAVPISAFVAVCATGFRFGINFKVQHPNRPDRNVINYEVVTVTMPLVFLGSLIGVEMGPIIGNTA